MLILENHSLNPVENLAFENSLCGIGHDIFMLWRNNPSVIVGNFTNTETEVNTEYARENNIVIVRRSSGGGAVYHDLGNVNYTFIKKDDKKFTLEYFSRIIINVLESIGINTALEFNHNDIKTREGLKISGAAQYHHDGILLHHGTLLFNTDLTVISKVLKHSGKVADIKPLLKNEMNVQEFMNSIRRKIYDNF